MVDGLIREAWLVVDDQRHDILPRNVSRGNDDEFVPGNVRSEFDAEYFTARAGVSFLLFLKSAILTGEQFGRLLAAAS